MKFLSFCLSLSLVAFASAAEDDHDHESCACAAEKDGFVIDCMNQQAMLDAIAALGANGCETDCENVICHTNFFILQSHHDYCLEAEVPETVEDSLHIYEDGCDSCEILKKVDPGLDDCPPHNCQDTSGTSAFTAMINAGCVNDCSTAFCSSNYKTLKAVHDLCEEDDLSTEAELGFHDFSEACSAESCNVGDAELELEQLICTEGDNDEHAHESCACAAEKDGFVIDCMDQQAMLDAIAALGANGCETDCENVICHTNFHPSVSSRLLP